MTGRRKQSINMMEKYSIKKESDITIVTFNSDPKYQDLIEMLGYLAKNNLYKKRLFDLSTVVSDISVKDIISMATYGREIFPLKNKGAVVTSTDFSFGESRQLASYREDANCLFNSFRSKEEAMKWLLDD